LGCIPVANVGPGAVQHPEHQLAQVNGQRLHRHKGVLTVEGVVGEKAALVLCEAPVFHAAPEPEQGGEVQENHQLNIKKNNSREKLIVEMHAPFSE